jgi:F-box/leucine-rich repeat protein 2/20
LSNLTSLSLESGYNINDECVRLLAENLKNLQKICLKNTKITNQSLEYLASLPKLHHIDLSKCPLFPPRPRPRATVSERTASSNDETQLAAELDTLQPVNSNFEVFFLKVGPRITSLSLAHCFTIRASYFVVMAKYLSANITFLDLAECREITNEALISITRSTTNLESLNLDSCLNFNDYGAMQLATNCPKLKSLNLARCNIQDQGVIVISKGLTKLEYLNLSANFALTDKAVLAIAKNLTNLKHLNLSFCSKIKDEAIIKLVETIPTLQYLNLEGCINITNRALSDIAKHCRELETLILARCSAITDSGVVALATGVPTLVTLDLSNLNRLTDKGVIALAKYLPSIENIWLQNCEKVTEAALSHIEQNKTIKSTVLPTQSQLLIKELSSQLSSPKLLLSTRDKPINIPKPKLQQPSGVPENEELRQKIAIVRQRHDTRTKLLQESESQEVVDKYQESRQQRPVPQYDPFTVKYSYEALSARPRPPKCDPSNLEKYLTVEEFVKYFNMTPEEFERLPQWRKLKKKTDLRLF